MLEDNINCKTSYPVYKITYNLCSEVYIGESSRTLNDRLSEHLRYARNPNSTSYRDEALTVHYRDQHAGLQPSLSFKLLAVERSTIPRKISEALYIQRFNPQLNEQEECVTLKRFLICCEVLSKISPFSISFSGYSNNFSFQCLPTLIWVTYMSYILLYIAVDIIYHNS